MNEKFFAGTLILIAAILAACAPAPTPAPPTPAPTATPIAISFELVSIIKGDSTPLKAPTGIAVDKQGNLYVMDAGNSRIVKFDSSGKPLTAWGMRGEGDGQFDVDFSGGGRIAVDGQGNVYVAGSNYRIQKFDSSGKFLTKWGSRGDGDGQFSPRVSVAVDSRGNVYTSEFENNRLEKFDTNGNFILKLGGKGSGDAEFLNPAGVSVDQNDDIYVGELVNSRVQKFSRDGKAIAKFVVPPIGDKAVRPMGVAADVQGNLYMIDHLFTQVVKLDNSGILMGVWGGRGSGDSQFGGPWGVAVDAQGNIYVSDGTTDRIQKFRQK